MSSVRNGSASSIKNQMLFHYNERDITSRLFKKKKISHNDDLDKIRLYQNIIFILGALFDKLFLDEETRGEETKRKKGCC